VARDYQISEAKQKLFAGRSLLLKSPQPLTLLILVEWEAEKRDMKGKEGRV
jgi:hypothetical protein